MVRALSLLGFGGTFLMISPNLRGILTGGIASAVGGQDQYSPWSYVGCAAGLLLALTLSMSRTSRPR